MREIFYSFLFFCFIFTIFSCGKTLDENVNDALGTGADSIGTSYSCSFKNTKAFIVGNAVTEKCMSYDCPKSKIVIWDLNGCMKVVGESELGAVDAASHNNSIYIADDAGYYWIVGEGNKIEKKKINNSSGYKLSEITGISVNSVGNVYVAGNVVKNKKAYLYGSAIIKYENTQIQAGYIEIDWNTNIITATGIKDDSTGITLQKPIFSEGNNEFKSDEIN